jgi:hypothetical protein
MPQGREGFVHRSENLAASHIQRRETLRIQLDWQFLGQFQTNSHFGSALNLAAWAAGYSVTDSG